MRVSSVADRKAFVARVLRLAASKPPFRLVIDIANAVLLLTMTAIEQPESLEMLQLDSDKHLHVLEGPTDVHEELFYPSGFRRFFSINYYATCQTPEQLVLSNCISPTLLLAVRVTLALWMLVWLIFTLFIDNPQGGGVLLYFTVLSFIGLGIYSAVMLYISIRYRHDPHSLILRHSRWLRMTASVLYVLAFSYHIIVPVVFWAILAPAASKTKNLNPFSSLNSWLNLVQHGLDFAVIFIHFICGAMSMPLRLLGPQILFGILYMFWSWVWRAAGSDWAYPFLDFKEPAAKYMYPVLFIAFALVYLLGMGLHWIRDRFPGCRTRARINQTQRCNNDIIE